MSDATYKYLLSDARKALASRRLLSALQSLQGMAAVLRAADAGSECASLISSYSMLLSYMTKGADDPQRGQMYRRFVRRAYELADILEREGELGETSSFYAACARSLQLLPGGPHTIARLTQQEGELRNLFDAVWLSGPLSTADETALSAYVTNDSGDSTGRLLVVSALTLAAMRFFDIAKYRILLDAALSAHTSMRVRALSGLVFVHMAHGSRVALYPDVWARLRLLSDVKGLKQELEMLQAQLFLSLETKRIERSLRDEIMPQVIKRMENLHIDRSLGLDEIKDKINEADLNPEWEEDGTPSKLAAYLHEFAELQQRGADMYMSSFKLLKQRYPFFNVAANWFIPFSLNHPDVPQQARDSRSLKIVLSKAGLCDSDKFSFCFMASVLSNKSLQAEAEEERDELLDDVEKIISEEKTTPADEFKMELRSYVQGFYRFCNLFIHREAFVNPFTNNLFIVDYPPFNELLADGDFLVRMADFTFKDKTYALAATLYARIERHKLTAAQSQRLGYCYEQEGQFDKAANAYELANAIKPNSEWTLRRLAACRRNLEQFDEAQKAYSELEALRPEDAALSLRQAECLIHLQRYEEAFKYLFKADYLAPESGQSARALAWCSLLTGKYEQAEKYYGKVLATKPTLSDWLNAGHAAWLRGDVAEAANRYVRALPPEEPEAFLAADSALLHNAGLSDDDLALMTDAVLALKETLPKTEQKQ